ncbi:MAG: zinc ribbon domain-containing protein [bacterium]|nr:zinc ribbon domain-containing protein [bacterium]
MNCSSCGVELEKGALICPKCGTVVVRESKKLLTKKEFWELPAVKPCRVNINTAAGIIYACCVLNVALKVTGSSYLGQYVSVIEALLVAGVAVWMQLAKSRTAAILLLVYGILSMIISSVLAGKIVGWFIPLAGAYAVVYTFRFQKDWKRYQEEGVRPQEIPERVSDGLFQKNKFFDDKKKK